MSVHIGAKETEIAESILLPGDPLRAKYIAENFLEGAMLYNEVRGMYGYTGTYKGKRVSVQGTGMGIPSISIYTHELIHQYGVKQLIRVGSCGGVQQNIKIRDVILAMTASTDSSVNRLGFKGMDYAPAGSFELLQKAYSEAAKKGMDVHVGGVFTSDTFYNDDPDRIKLLNDYRILAIEMETSALYTIAAKAKVQALSILTVSDHIVTGEETSAAERQNTFNEMIEIALETVVH
ncbi:purine-nucleoside phosphorylase [Ammoniphilus resinae]|uniref:Purine nucleoside phosphorylase DeoD-type n=1 Tax=Ammoniphilus resinae TaxID=861532 RepID=A0ABS4GN49_9BACL|nr:purine-nucleoside phosphorylase [Ammoniphilus resinae]